MDNLPRSTYHHNPNRSNSTYTIWLSDEAITGLNKLASDYELADTAEVIKYIYDNQERVVVNYSICKLPFLQQKAKIRMLREVYHFIISLSHKYNIAYHMWHDSINFQVLSAVIEAIGIGAITIAQRDESLGNSEVHEHEVDNKPKPKPNRITTPKRGVILPPLYRVWITDEAIDGLRFDGSTIDDSISMMYEKGIQLEVPETWNGKFYSKDHPIKDATIINISDEVYEYLFMMSLLRDIRFPSYPGRKHYSRLSAVIEMYGISRMVRDE